MGKQIDMHCSLIKIGAQILGSAVRLQRVPDPMSKAGYAERIAPLHHSSVGTHKLEISRAVEHCEFSLGISTKLFGMGGSVTVIHWESSQCAMALKLTHPPLACRDPVLRCV